MESEALLIFSESQQQAIIGYALQFPDIWEMLDEYGIDEHWMANNVLADCYKQISDFRKTYDKPPQSAQELIDFVTDDLIKTSVKNTLSRCVDAKKRHSWLTLQKHLVSWAKSRHVYVSIKELAQKYNDGKHQEAFSLFDKAANELQRIEVASGVELDGFQSATERMKGEAIERQKDASKCIEYSIKYLQDATGGMLPNETVLWGATSGAGKTEAGKNQAAFTAKTLQEPTHYFALEADYREIERRIYYGILADLYKKDHTGTPPGVITYANFRKNRLLQELDPYSKQATDEFAKQYSTLHTYYRRNGDFGIKQLEKQFMKLKGQSRLIVLDHVHFMDLETDNETREMTQLIKKIRDVSALIQVPIIMIAHITEKGIKHNELVPRREDFYGASNLFKVAITAIMMAPVKEFSASDNRAFGKPTLLRIVKARIDNSLQYFPGIVYFDSYINDYTDYYSVGKFEKGNKKWCSLKGELPYWVNMERNVTDVSDVE